MTVDVDRPDWRAAVLAPGATVEEAIRNLNSSNHQIVLVLTDGDELVGTITDGDIRRGLLKGVGLQEIVDSLMHTDPVVVTPADGRDAVLQLMEELHAKSTKDKNDDCSSSSNSATDLDSAN